MSGMGDQTGKIPTLPPPPPLVSEDAFHWPGRPLARGGMAVVYEGDDRRLARKVILKAPRDDVPLPEGMETVLEDRIEAESRVLARLQHPSVVTIYELGRTSAGTPFCVLQKVEGKSLHTILDELAEEENETGKRRTRERLELLTALVSIAEAIAYAHERGVVHRDVTPNNILIGPRGEAVLIDWGLAKDVGAKADASFDKMPSSDSETISAGTPPYVCLEQTRGLPADPGYDVYSFGVTLYEVVSGRTPFDWPRAENTYQHLERIRKYTDWLEANEPIEPAAPGDPELSGIIARAIARSPEERFTADELLRALKQYLTGELVFSHRYSLTGRIGRWVRRHRGLAVSLLGMLAAIVAAVIIFLALRAESARYARDRAQLELANARVELENERLAAANAEQQRKNAELGAIAASAKMDAADKKRAAEEAAKAAAAAQALAEEATRRGLDADALRAEAEKQKTAADAARAAAEDAAKVAETAASEAAEAAKAAEAAREAEAARRAAAEAAKSEAELAKAEAEREKEAAREARARAEADRKAAEDARDAAEKERDEALRRVEELEARVKELEDEKRSGTDPGPGPETDAGP